MSDARKKLGNKASRIRSRIKLGKKVRPQDRKFLEEWEAGTYSPKAEKVTEKPPAPVKESPLAKDPPKTEAPEKPVERPQVTAGPKPPPPPIPDDAPLADGDWRKKYMMGESREDSCKAIAHLWAKGLKRMNRDIAELGGTAIVPDAMVDSILFPAMILVVDKYTPEGVKIDPTMASAIGTTVVTGQRVYMQRTAQAKKKAAASAEPEELATIEARPKPEDADKPAEQPNLRSVPTADGVVDDYDFEDTSKGTMPL